MLGSGTAEVVTTMADSNMQTLDLEQLSSSTIVIVAPHMDDEALACGGLIALLPNKERIHVIYAADGSQSPAPVFRWQGEVSPDLSGIRMHESIDAMNELGVPNHNLHFLYFPDGRLRKNMHNLRRSIREKIGNIDPQIVFVPFRYDRHPDHLAVNLAVASEIKEHASHVQVAEYFVYHRWRLLPKRDIRKYIKPEYLFQLAIDKVSTQKRRMLDCFVSQSTNFYSWQTRPILTPTLLDEECQNPEYFLIAPDLLPDAQVFTGAVFWIQLAHWIEPILLRWKGILYSLAPWIFQRHDRR